MWMDISEQYLAQKNVRHVELVKMWKQYKGEVGPVASMQFMEGYSKWYEVRTYVVGYHGCVCGM